MLDTESLVNYWLTSLQDSELIAPNTDAENSINVTWQEIREGQLKSSSLKNLVQLVDPKDEENITVDILISPFVYKHKWQKRNVVKTFLPIFISVTVTQEGALRNDNQQFPWIPRDFLEPSGSPKVIGSIEAYDDYINKAQIPLSNAGEYSWSKLFDFCKKMHAEVTESDTFLDKSYELEEDRAKVIISDLVTGASKPIQHVFDNIRKHSHKPLLLGEISRGRKEEQIKSLPAAEENKIAGKHLGSVNNKYALAPSQRNSYYNFLTLSEKSIQAIKGPPGTGKTTLLQTVIATKWIEAALEGDEPPVIVASSTNNQAVVNVIKSFGDLRHIKRWVSVESFGLFLTNKKRKDVEGTFGKETLWVNGWANDDSFPTKIEDTDFIGKERRYYLDHCSNFFNEEIDNIDEAVNLLHSYLSKLNTLLQSGIEIANQLFRTANELQDEVEGDTLVSQIEFYLRVVEDKLEILKSDLKQIKKAKVGWIKHQESEPWLYSLLSWLRPIKKKIQYRNEAYILGNPAYIESGIEPENINRVLSSKIVAAKKKITESETEYNRVQTIKNKWESWLTEIRTEGIEIEEAPENWQQFNNQLDTTLRYKLFEVATHYWEGRWFKKAEKFEEKDNNGDDRNKQGQKERFRRYACLTPCMVTTLHTGPSILYHYYRGEEHPLYDFIDLLIIDEAGQASPEIAGGMFALAKQALAVGDAKQIKPIQNLTEEIDKGNLEQLYLIKSKKSFPTLKSMGILSSSGSVMEMAKQVSKISPEDMTLKEHWRCVPEIINYCNDLAYDNQLIPKRKSEKNLPWPAMGYIHIWGNCRKAGSSYKNIREALTIVEWIKDNEGKLKSFYNVNAIENIVGIITPYSPQKNEIKKQLRKAGIEISKVGTVHSLQGAERPIVIFSPVCDRNFKGVPFYDKGINMLNVAVSRAKDSFIVVGDMDVFDPGSSRPSGILAKHLFKDGANELSVEEVKYERETKSEVDRITDIEKHRYTLKKVFRKAIKRVIIVSPFIRDRAVMADGIVSLTKKSVKKDVKVKIYIDNHFNKGLDLPAAKKAYDRLKKAGAEINICHNIHSKILCKDEDVFIEGSFNWLSSERELNKYMQYETSSIHMGDQTRDYIQETLKHMNERHQKYLESVSVNK